MAIACHKLGMAFFVPQLPGIQPFKMFLHKLDHDHSEMRRPPRLRFIHKAQGYQTVAYDTACASVPEGYKRIAVVMDPADLIAHVWHTQTGARTFKQNRQAGAVANANLPLTPSLPVFLENLERYKAASELLRSSLDSQTFALGDDLTGFDDVIRIDSTADLTRFFADVTDTQNDPSATAIAVSLPGIILNRTFGMMDDLTKDDYRRMQRAVSHDTSRLMTERARTLPVIPTLRRGAPSDAGLHVVCMLKETPEVVVRFVDYYSALGCTGIHLYFDDPDDPGIEQIAGRDNVVVTRCGPAFWGKHRIRAVEGRQARCYNHCYQGLGDTDGWLIVCDADEFVTATKTSVPELLAKAPADHPIVRFRSGEAVWPAGDTDFAPFSAPYLRTQVSTDGGSGAAGKKPREIQPLFRRGMLSHGSGKYALRLGRKDAKLGIHKVDFDDGFDSMRPPKGAVTGQLVHFDAVSFAHWKRKAANRATGKSGFVSLGPVRDGQVNAYSQAQENERLALFRNFYGIDAEDIEMLTRAGALYHLDIFDGLPSPVQTGPDDA